MKDSIKKLLFKKLKALPDNRVLLWMDFHGSFENVTGESLNDHLEAAEAVLEELAEKGYARYEEFPGGMPRVIPGINFDEWEQAMGKDRGGSNISIASLQADHVQVGDHNEMNINVTPAEFLAALEKIRQDPEKSRSLLQILDEKSKQGLSLTQTILEFIRLFT